MISQKYIIKVIDETNVQFLWCWNHIVKLRQSEIDVEEMVVFQIRLAKAFVKLDQIYREVKLEQRRLIRGKSRYKEGWFIARMGKLGQYLNAVKNALGVGRTIGDGFAWIFYRNETSLLEEHSKEQQQLLLPPKIGRIGEVAFIEHNKTLGGMFVLYHAITSFLRLGDVSFFDPAKGKITAVGELKTHHLENNQYNITLGLVFGDKDNSFLSDVKFKEQDPSAKLENSTEQKLKRQVNQIAKSLQKRDKHTNDRKINLKAKSLHAILGNLVRKSNSRAFLFKGADKGLVLGVWKPRQSNSFGQRLLSKSRSLEAALTPVKDAAMEILNPNLSDNCMFVGTIGDPKKGFPVMLAGSTPLIWWPLNEKVLHDLIFGHVIVISLFNPAHLWELLRGYGFAIVINDRSQVTRISKRIGEKRLEIEHFGYFERLTPYGLVDEKSVATMINSWADHAFCVSDDGPVKVGIRPRFVL